MRYACLQLPRVSDTAMHYGIRGVHALRHPVYACLGLRPALAQHTNAEHAAVRRWAAGRKSLVEIGVAEGVSALALREAMASDAKLYLIDPFHLSRFPSLNFMRRTAHRLVESCPRGQVLWMEQFSEDAVRGWRREIDLLLIDGDHAEAAVERDWNQWSPFVTPGGVVMFHDACLFDGGWTTPDYGPVRLVNHLFRNGHNPEWMIVDEVHSMLVVERKR